jgi:hypothetical protein
MINAKSFSDDAALDVTRRYFLGQCGGVSLGATALGLMSGRGALGSTRESTGLEALPHRRPRAKNVIFLTQSGGPSQIELFDDKPGLMKWAGQELPDSVRQGQRLTTMTSGQKQLVKPAAAKFLRHGQSGAMVGEWLPHIGGISDEVCFIKSMVTEEINHAPAMTKFLTGNQIPDWGARMETCRTISC